ncbi:MAG: hypothetical protein A3C93_04195 [Candidatus Lloydbacteria bacterium RIFCSPHIGHO2_02_FULL_54_17]|uniref:Uncharacterized protein n=1 Tax=Candidatus Lloydbacteria bacterium RIFCSPHIGHO2_02_FULL_54_17 TaxID=1798664 RepID=A0A1G2DKE0_9BACT|nr:MAG: hypothetical protein A3C93_04195 [Candidatus Lloydbacteria bacterium RIFCSPHIGHO2_02_FULL_54_17]
MILGIISFFHIPEVFQNRHNVLRREDVKIKFRPARRIVRHLNKPTSRKQRATKRIVKKFKDQHGT